MQRNKNHSFLKSSPSVYRHSEFLHEWTLFAAVRARAINLSRDIYSYVSWKYEINTNEKCKKNRPRYRLYTYAYTFFCSILNCAHVCLRGGTRRPLMPKKCSEEKKTALARVSIESEPIRNMLLIKFFHSQPSKIFGEHSTTQSPEMSAFRFTRSPSKRCPDLIHSYCHEEEEAIGPCNFPGCILLRRPRSSIHSSLNSH